MTVFRLLVVEDDPELRLVLSRGLGEEGFEVVAVGDAASAMAQSEEPADGLVIDIGLPDADGRDLCQALRARGVDAPVLFLTARDAVTDRLSGFSAGGDDYVTKPFHFDELVARLRALLRRSGATPRRPVGALRLDPVAHSISGHGGEVSLTPTEFRLLAALARPAGRRAAPARARARGMARGRDRARQHAGPIRGAPAPQAARDRGTRRRSRPCTGSATGCYEALSDLARPAHGARAARGARRRGGARRWPSTSSSIAASTRTRTPGARSLAAAAAATVEYQNGHLLVHESVDDAIVDRRVWIYDGARAVERPPATAELQRTADALAGSAHVFDDVPGGDVRLYAAPVEVHGRQVGTAVAAQSLAAYDRTTDLALLGSVVLAAGAARRGGRADVDHRRARPGPGARDDLARRRTGASAISPQRFGATPRPDELGELARTFDALLDRVAASLRHEQRLSAELSHELRTPLARIVAEIELLQRRERSAEDRNEAYAVVARSAEQMSAILETLMAAARAEAQLDVGRSEVGGVLDRVAEGWAPAVAERELELEVRHPAGPMMAGVDAEVVERIVAPLIDNALRYARSHILLSAVAREGAIVLSVADDGPGVGAQAREHVFEPGRVAGGAMATAARGSACRWRGASRWPSGAT